MKEINSQSLVVLKTCRTYDIDLVKEAIREGIQLIGGFSSYINPDDEVLLKPNMLSAVAPERAVTTNPVIFSAVIQLLQEQQINPAYGDSPGVISFRKASIKTGLQEIARRHNISEISFRKSLTRHFQAGIQHKQFEIYESFQKFDKIISIPKFKTHNLTRITGAVKNQYGCLTFRQKREFHAVLKKPEYFARMLLDLNRCMNPCLYIVDAIEAMDGDGPMNGKPYKLGLIAISDDALALDATLCRIINLDPYLVDYLNIGEKSGFGNVAMDHIELLGDPVESFKRIDFVVNRNKIIHSAAHSVLNFFFDRMSVIPIVDNNMCVSCGDCEKACPTNPKSIRFSEKNSVPEINYNSCIQCYCCIENCPHQAMRSAKKAWLSFKGIF